MLAYVFWHFRKYEVNSEAYETRLTRFHEVLNAQKPSGFIRSYIFRFPRIDWLPSQVEVYEDWYILENSAALDVLNVAAISSPCQQAHDQAANQVAEGKAGLFRLRVGKSQLEYTPFVYWLAKPEGMIYDDFFAILSPWTSQEQASLWGRQMVLGPTPEFCLRAPEPLNLPERFEIIDYNPELIWSQ
ncbi:MAG: hypothetical protein GWN62_27585 [Aliifodinibius sp.]|nr:hypothetical protein [Fodinibius sp.]